MLRSLLPLALQSTLRRRRSSALVFSVLLLSFSCAIMALSLTESIRNTNDEYRLDTYGGWFVAIADAQDGEADYIAAQDWAGSVGTASIYSITLDGALGVMDEAAVDACRVQVLEGRLPEKEGEIAMTRSALLENLRRVRADEDELLASGDPSYVPRTAEEIDRYELGQDISLSISITYSYSREAALDADGNEVDPASDAAVTTQQVWDSARYYSPRTFTLVGVLEEYHDMWGKLSPNRSNTPYLEMLVTEEAVESMRRATLSYAQSLHDNIRISPLRQQLYVTPAAGLDDEAMLAACSELAAYMQQTRPLDSDREPSRNLLSYPGIEPPSFRYVSSGGATYTFSSQEELDAFLISRGIAVDDSSDQSSIVPARLYALLIAAVALAAVLCVYLMQLPAEVHSFTVLRSIGITKPQLLLLAMLESALLVVPATVLGVPLGALLTRLALHLLMYSDSVEILVSVPYGQLFSLFLLWLAVIVAVRLVLFFVTIRTPITGRMQLSPKRARRQRQLHGAMIAALTLIFCLTAVYTADNAAERERERLRVETAPGFRVYENNNWAYQTLIPTEWVERIRSFPGVLDAEVYCDDMTVWLSYDGLEEMSTGLWVIEARNWGNSFDFGDDLAAFEAGELVLLCFPESQKELVSLPGDTVRLRTIYNKECTIDVTSAVRVEWTSDDPIDRGTLVDIGSVGGRNKYILGIRGESDDLGMWDSYQVVCSPAFFERFLTSIVPDGHWYYYTEGDAVGYEWILVTVDMDLYEQLSTNRLLENFCSEYSTKNRRVLAFGQQDNYQQRRQMLVQELILLYSCGACVALVTLLLLAAALSMEAEQERRSFTILRVIGMSGRQMRRRVFGKALRRGVLSVGAGFALYAALLVRGQMAAEPSASPAEALRAAWSGYTGYASPASALALAAALLAVLLAITLLSKRALRQNTTLK